MSTRCPKCGAVVEDDWPVCRQCFEPVKRPGLLSRFLRGLGINVNVTVTKSSGPGSGSTLRMVTNRTETIRIRDSITGEEKEYHSIDEVPEAYREKIRQAQQAALAGKSKIMWTDRSGTTHTYNSVDEMPPEVRAIYEKARANSE